MNFIELVKPYLSPALMQNAAAWLGESESGVSKALTAVFPTLMGAIIGKADNRGFTETLSGMLASPNLNASSLLTDVSGVFNASNAGSPTGELGALLLSSLFGDKQQSLGQAISQHAGIGIGSVGKLLGASAPVLLALLSKQSQAGGLSALMAQLAGQKAALLAAIPGSIGAAAGLSGAGAATAASSFSANSRVEAKSAGFPLWLIPLVALIAIGLWWFLKPAPASAPDVNQPAALTQAPAINAPVATPPAVAAPSGDVLPAATSDSTAATDADGFIDRTLPGDVKINIPSAGAEANLLGFIEDATLVVDKETWFELDRVLFDSDTASLSAESSVQVANIAAILKAFSNVQLKIGGYTDNSGDAAANLKLSADRANSVLTAIAALGVDTARLKAEGYGPEHPVADNATEEGRQKNRRVSARVTAK